MSDQQQAFLVKANGFVFTLTESDMAQADIVAEANHVYHLIYQHQSVNGKVLDAAADHKTMQVEVHGNTYDVNIKDSLDQMLDSMGYSAAGSKHIKEVKAPMPGLVLSVSVEAGQQVQEGDRLLILEAMKMENSIMIHAAATIKSVLVKAGQAVDKGQVLVVLE
ncbi:MAG: acetyl-CoA carboxylase biotin carboxyl carrier protein subunit [Bacteroidetes bacterium]|uniref:acetyl-CoA carboxylase biotin carboxyl carrier protein subunit n=1 Tax=Phnomibacter sp. TaxID=2836217 RepID=UPI002FDDA24D|nr:acetyl-CoA carboxylase biotin carboxyl carrier protein subunit [Bacteroidota bacterium]